jgi:hypothetical protein
VGGLLRPLCRAEGQGRARAIPAYGCQAPSHRWSNNKLKWRELRIGLGLPPVGSSPAKQQQLGLNRDVTLHPKQGKGETLRK